MSVSRVLAAGLISGFLLAGCGSDDSGSSSDDVPETGSYVPAQVGSLDETNAATLRKPASSEDLAGRGFVLLESEGEEIAPGVQPRIEFTKSRVAIDTPCNNISVGFRLDSGRFEPKGKAGTVMACAPERMDAEEWLSDLFSRPSKMTQEDGRLLIRSGNNTALFGEVPQHVAELEKWLWINDRTKLIFRAGSYSILSPCRSGSGAANIGEDTISFETYGVLTPCTGDDDPINDVLDMLDGTVEYTLRGKTGARTLLLARDGEEVVFEAITPSDLG